MMEWSEWITRRRAIQLAAALAVPAWLGAPTRADGGEDRIAPEKPPRYSSTERLEMVVAGRTPIRERVRLEMPQLAEDGSVVPVKIIVDSPMTEEDHVRVISLIVANNPDPLIFTSRVYPALGAVEWRMKIRMADTSRVWVFADMSDGALYMGETDVEVTLGGCG